jgi:hypothetical protein
MARAGPVGKAVAQKRLGEQAEEISPRPLTLHGSHQVAHSAGCNRTFPRVLGTFRIARRSLGDPKSKTQAAKATWVLIVTALLKAEGGLATIAEPALEPAKRGARAEAARGEALAWYLHRKPWRSGSDFRIRASHRKPWCARFRYARSSANVGGCAEAHRDRSPDIRPAIEQATRGQFAKAPQ